MTCSIRYHGWKGLYRDIPVTLSRDLAFYSAFFTTYETLRNKLREVERRDSLGVGETATIGAVAGVAAWSVALPMDNLTARFQVDHLIRQRVSDMLKVKFSSIILRDYKNWCLQVCLGKKSVTSIAKDIIQEGGYRNFYRCGNYF